MNIKRIIREEINNDLQWIKDVKPTLNDAFEQGTLKKGDVLTLSGELADCDAITTKEVNDFKIKITKLKKNINNSYFIPLQKKYWKHLEYEGKGDTRFYRSDGKMTIEDHHNNLNESNDLQWIRDINPIPNEILNIDKYPPGDYKIWLGDIPKDQQLMIIDYIIDVIESRDDLSTSSSLYSIRDIVRNDEAYFNSLYFGIYPPGKMNKSKTIVVAMMAWYPKDGLDKYHTLEYCRKYFDRHGDTELSTAKIEDHHNELMESNELEWIQGGPDFNLQTSEFYIDLDGVSDKKACEIQQKILDMGVYWSGKGKNLKKEHCKSKAYIIKKGKLYISTYNYNKYNTMVKQLKDTTENFPRLYGKNFSQLFK